VNRRRLGTVLALVAAFGLGAVAGGFGMRGYMFNRFVEDLHAPPGKARMQFRMEAMSRKLDLTRDQQEKIQRIFESHEDERRQMFERCAPDHRALKAKVDTEVRAILTPEQQKKFDELDQDRHGK
jgi:Spy/CpxP family protein refolding chaperone